MELLLIILGCMILIVCILTYLKKPTESPEVMTKFSLLEQKLDTYQRMLLQQLQVNQSEANEHIRLLSSQFAELTKSNFEQQQKNGSIVQEAMQKIHEQMVEMMHNNQNAQVKVMETVNASLKDIENNNRELNEQQSQKLEKGMQQITEQMVNMIDSNAKAQQKTMETVAQSLEQIQHNNTKLNEQQSLKIESAIGKMTDHNEKKLEEMRKTVDEKLTETLSSRLNSSFKTVSQQLENVYRSLGEMKELSSGVTDSVTGLNRILTNVKARGTWAEVQLENILNQTIPGMFDTNVATKSNSQARVEFAVKIPVDANSQDFSYLPIDSKFPMEDYIRLTEAADRADAQALEEARKALEARVKAEAKSIASYINVPKTTPFAIMYLATEGLYAEITSSKTGLAEKIQADYHIMITGPSTITALLNSLSMGFKTLAINKKADEVWKILGVAKAQYDKFGDILLKAKKKVDEAGNLLGDAQHRNSIIQKKLKKVELLDDQDTKNLLSEFDEVDEKVSS